MLLLIPWVAPLGYFLVTANAVLFTVHRFVTECLLALRHDVEENLEVQRCLRTVAAWCHDEVSH